MQGPGPSLLYEMQNNSLVSEVAQCIPFHAVFSCIFSGLHLAPFSLLLLKRTALQTTYLL